MEQSFGSGSFDFDLMKNHMTCKCAFTKYTYGIFAISSKLGDEDQSEFKDLSPVVNGIKSELSKNK